MVHADSSRFRADISKEDAYAQVLEQAEVLFEGQRNWVCNLANAASLLWHMYKALPEPSSHVNWAGFYTLHPHHPDQLILGPFQGRVACQTIFFGRGVCGRAVTTQTTQVVPDVDKFPGHIACDGETRSEIVVPIIVEIDVKARDVVGKAANGVKRTGGTVQGRTGKKIVAVLDVDCILTDGFDEVDRRGLEALAVLLAQSCDW